MGSIPLWFFIIMICKHMWYSIAIARLGEVGVVRFLNSLAPGKLNEILDK